MRKYLVSGTSEEQLETMEILAKSPEEAREVLYDLWMNGQTHGIGYELCDVDIRDGGEHLYTYLAKFSLRDGEHEYHAEFLQRLPKVLSYTGDAPLGSPINVVRVQHFCEPL